MSGLAEESQPSGSHAVPTSPAHATVIPLRRTFGAPHPSASGADRQAGAPNERTDIAAFWEKIFTQQGRTLADTATADAHRITAATIGLLIEGARAEGVLDDDQAEYLSTLTVEAVRAPDFL
ncbi:hypothetical protein [Streptomyces sp. AC1-42T]|uniref:hypothetical protein n=1 Tax=Streptomyces sp. AC1-42T TaxID=2218665 RepID=UPI000DADAA4B|nr:hypothetical protein [Streptomyces sp. AC1-42T]PZT71432.1 hypothetical protein DNK55_32480 [Streptomyces sp. AC1-42T]